MKKIYYLLLIILAILFLMFIAEVVDGRENSRYKVSTYDNYSFNSEARNLLFVVDFSNSMGEFLEHKTKVSQVKSVLDKILPQISIDTNVGIRVYGHTCNIFAFNACRSSELLVPLNKNNSGNIINSISKLRPRGMTPITYSLKQAVKNDLVNSKGNKHIILLTDGGENCDESPCDYAIELMKERRDINIDVIAFDVQDSEDLDQLKCVADVTSGKFIEANTNAQLVHSMENLILPHKQVEAMLLNTYD
ncbi:MAG: VWA domain-containing protein [Cyanobacteria bacterium SIG28]|nr:VWA domain-containing protein [Cyanobacteria bacterium SIG28]